MHYHDPQRPKVNFRPAYLSHTGRPIAPLPQLSVWPHENGKDVIVGMWLLTSPLAAQLYSTTIPIEDLSGHVEVWSLDPEEYMREKLLYSYEPKYTPRQRTEGPEPTLQPKEQPQFTLQDLGLEP